jgi:hypothetical protein
MTTLDDLGLLKMSRTFCSDHALEVVTITIGVCGVSYAGKANVALKDAIQASLKRVVGVHAEIASPESCVEIVLSDLAGKGMSVRATVIPPTGSLSTDIISKLSCSDSLGAAVIDSLLAVEGIATISSPPIRLDGVGLAKVVSVRLGSLADPDVVCAARQRPCRNCRGVLRLRFTAPGRFAERRAQLEDLKCEQLVHRAQLCGLADEATMNGASPEGHKKTVNLIIKSEGIIR